MQLMRRAALDGVQLDSLDERIIIQSIEPAAGKDTLSAVSLGGADGSRLTGKHRDWLDVNIKITINEKSYHPAQRDAVLDKVRAWAAKGGILTVNYKEGKQLSVICAQQPAEGDLASRGGYTITLRALAVPYWEATQAKSVTLTQDDEGEGTLVLSGSAKTIGEVTVQNKSGDTLQTLAITVNGREMAFTGLGLANNGYLVIDHVQAGGRIVKRARIGQASVLDKLEGADEFILEPGSNSISYEAGGDVIVTVSAKERWE